MTDAIMIDTKTTFPGFIDRWNDLQKQDTPAFHTKIAEWLERQYKANARMLLMAFRSAGKSTLAGLFSAWLLLREPNTRILVMAADQALAGKMVRQVKRILERHPLTKHLKPKSADQWASDRFTVARDAELRDPSMLAKGITANITGARADVIICDDVEVPNTTATPEKRASLRERLVELTYVLAHGGRMLYIGTPHNYHSIYAENPRVELDEETAFLEGYERLVIPIEDEDGISAWPEHYSSEDIARLKRHTGPNKFASQMLLRPVNITEGRLKTSALRYYEGVVGFVKELRQIELAGKRMISASAYWDPALGNSRDRSVLAVVFTDEDGESWLQQLKYLELDNYSDVDEATQQCRQVAREAQLLLLPSITVETNGIGGLLPEILRREINKIGFGCTVKKKHNTRPKDLRILESFDAILAARSLHVHKRLLKTPFISEMQEWKPGLKNARDDGLDAVAGALEQEPLRLRKRQEWKNRPSWRPGSKSRIADTEFEV